MTFQQGAAGYEGQQDTVIVTGADQDTNFGTEGHVSADQQDSGDVRQGLLKLEDIFGPDPGQIPLGSTINSATLDVFVQDDSNAAMQMSLYRMLTDWDELTATWNSFGAIGGVQASEGDSTDLPPDAVLLDAETDFQRPATAGRFDVTRSLEYWAAGADNFGWLLESAATNGWDFRTNNSDVASRPRLTVDFTPPAATTSYQIVGTAVSQAEGNSGTRIARVDVARLGDISAATSINYTVTAGGPNPAQSADFVEVAAAQALNFAAGDGLAAIEVTINGDTNLEGLETVLVTLSGGAVVAGRDVSTLTIADDDILISEVLANVSNSADDETDREYIELAGTPGANLTGYYFVVFESDEEEHSGAGSGFADFVIDLGPHTFGANGVLAFVPGDPGVDGLTWEYASLTDPASNIVELAALMGMGGVLEDTSQTYAVIRSPGGAIMPGTDYDTVGAYESAAATAIGVGVGILDQLPAGAELVDSVGVVRGGGGDRDRVATTAALGHPGVHVHQPESFISGGNVTSDAVTRRIGQTLPNSIGAWFNGDISDGNPANAPIRYLEDTVAISVVSPDGAVITPGAPNILRNVFFSLADQQEEVAEADGSVTVRIERTGDIENESLSVTYSTLDFGSAEENVDFTAETDTVTFDPGESFVDITIDINEADGLAEGFERFRVVLSDASAGYFITNGSSTGAGNPNGQATVTILDANVSLATFQDGVDGYEGTSDAYLDGAIVADPFGQDPVVRVDQAIPAGAGEVRPQQGLLRFDNLFGDGPGQVPNDARIFDAFLTLNVITAASGAKIGLFRMLQDWEQVHATWLQPQGDAGAVITNGVTPDGFEATAQADAFVAESGRAGQVQIPLNVDTIRAWANGSLPNFGWSIVTNSATSWSFDSSEADSLDSIKPSLTILYTDPVETEVGSFALSVENYNVNEGGTATITVNRFGGSNGPATVNWALSDGTGTLADITGASAGAVNFADGELFKTFTVATNNDTSLEINETLNLTLSGAGLTFDRTTATLTIRDNDFVPSSGNLLLNEIYMNSPGNDPPHEFIELSGLANMGLGSLYYVAIEGLAGPNTGAFDKVVDLGHYSSGSNGLTLLTPQEPGYAFNVNAETTHIQDLGTVAIENINTNNDSVTIMLVYSPTRELSTFAFDYDWDDDGSLDLPLGAQIVDSLGVRTLARDDQVYGPTANILSFTAAEVDSVSRKRDDSDRNDGTAWFGGNLTSAGDDYLLYEASSTALPVTGASMSPGDLNTGTDAQSPLVALTGVTPNANGTITVIFDAIISQVLAGDGSTAPATGSGITISDTSGMPIPVVDARPTVTGIGTNTLTLSFTGSGVVGGTLPAGMYQLNFVGNGFVANGRAVDVANDGTQAGGFREFEFTATTPTPLTGDYNGNGTVDAADYVVWRKSVGQTGAGLPADGDGDMDVDDNDRLVWRANFGRTAPPTVATATAAELSTAATEAIVESDSPVLVAAAAREQALFDWPQTAAAAKPEKVKGARWLSAASSALNQDLLITIQGGAIGNQQAEIDFVAAHDGSDETADVDEVFAELGAELI
jgi:hypothetical protein